MLLVLQINLNLSSEKCCVRQAVCKAGILWGAHKIEAISSSCFVLDNVVDTLTVYPL